MIWVPVGLCVLLAALNVVQLVLHHLERDASEKRRFDEQRELITRIQRPDLTPVKRPPAVQRDVVRDEIGKVGTVSHLKPGDG